LVDASLHGNALIRRPASTATKLQKLMHVQIHQQYSELNETRCKNSPVIDPEPRLSYDVTPGRRL